MHKDSNSTLSAPNVQKTSENQKTPENLDEIQKNSENPSLEDKENGSQVQENSEDNRENGSDMNDFDNVPAGFI